MDKTYFLYYLDSRQQLDPGEAYTIGRSPNNQILLPHLSVSRLHARLAWKENGFEIEDLNSTNGVLVNSRNIQRRVLINGDKLKIGNFNLQFIVRSSSDVENFEEMVTPTPTLAMERTVAELLQNVENPELAAKIMDLKHSFEKKRDELSDLAFKDTLTRVYNRRYFDQQLEDEVRRSKASGGALCLVMMDIDHFKKVNDSYGHQIGDKVMREIAGILCDIVRDDDTVARYGGEEIAVILPGVEAQIGEKIAERFRCAVAEYSLEGTDVRVTISLGVADIRGVDTAEGLIKAADNALYQAKRNGRNQVVVAD